MSVLVIGKFKGDTAKFQQALAQKFMSDPDLQAFIGSVGGAPEPPEVIVAQAISSPDEF